MTGSDRPRKLEHGRKGEPPPAPEPLSVPALDSHCHLDLMDLDVADAIAQAAAVGITRIVQVGVDLESSRWSADLADKHDAVLAAVALHPNDAPKLSDVDYEAALSELDILAARPRVRAIGETGLDFYRTGDDGRARQEESFRRHIDLAKRHGLALVIHDRDAHDDVLRVLAEEGAPERTVFHCFSGGPELARACTEHGYVMSFAGTVTFANAPALREAAAIAPLDLLLVETDAPFLTPMPYRGRPNAPYLVPLTVRAIAAAKGVSEDEVAAAVTATGERIFGAW